MHDRALALREPCLASIRPSEDFCSVVGGEDDDRVVVDAHILELLHRRQEFVFIAKMVLAKLCGVSAGRLTSCSSLVLPNRIVTHDMILSWQCT